MQDYTIAENAKSWLKVTGYNQKLNVEHIPNDLTGFNNYPKDRWEN